MKKTTLKWIAIGVAATGLVAFSAGMIYALNKLKKIKAEESEPEEDETDSSDEVVAE